MVIITVFCSLPFSWAVWPVGDLEFAGLNYGGRGRQGVVFKSPVKSGFLAILCCPPHSPYGLQWTPYGLHWTPPKIIFGGESTGLESSPVHSTESTPLSPVHSTESSPLKSSPVQSTESSPLQSTPVHSSPLKSTQVHSSPVHSSPVQSSPVQSTESSPLQSTPV